jgi:hypothetical protein
MSKLLLAWNRFWFAEQPTTPIALFRVLFGLLLLQVLLTELLPHFSAFYGVSAIVDTSNVVTYWWHNQPRFDLFLLVPQSDTARLTLFFIFIAFGIALTLGLFTRLSAIMTYFGLLTLFQHCPFNRDGGDAFMLVCSFILCFSHCGGAYSLDCLLAARRNPGAQLGRHQLFKPWAQRLLQIQVAIVYWHSLINKAAGETWQKGTAIYMSTHMVDFVRMPIPPQLDTVWMSQVLSCFTLITEFSLFTLIWFKPFRYWVLLLGLILHSGIEYTLNLPGFETIMMASYANFIEADDLDRVVDWLKRKSSQLILVFARN